MNMSEHARTLSSTLTWRRWEPPALPEHHVAGPDRADSQSSDQLARPQVDPEAQRSELDDLREAARQQGYALGYQEGHAQGLEQGTEAGRQAGHSAGYEDGKAEGLSAGQAMAQTQARRFECLADTCAASIHALETETGRQIVELALHIAQKVLQSALNTDPGHIIGLVDEVLRTNTDDQALLTLRLHPDDEATLRPYLESINPLQRWRIVSEPSLERGDCIAETVAGSIDATLATRWKRVTSSLGYDVPWKNQAGHAED